MDNSLTKEYNPVNGNTYKMGFAARLEEMPKNSNPYPVNTSEYRVWIAGYCGADLELNKKFNI